MKRRLNNGFKVGHKSLGGCVRKNRFTVKLWNRWLAELNSREIEEPVKVGIFRAALEFKHPTATGEI